MKKYLTKILGLTVIITVFGMMTLITSCEGPEGLAGTDGEGIQACNECHGFGAPVWEKIAQYRQSGHANGKSWERGSRGTCAPCHSGEGFALEVRGLDVVAPSQPSGVNCIHCHTIHKNYDDSDLVPISVSPVTLGGTFTDGTVVDLGKGNLCSHCHQTRLRTYWDEGGDIILSSYFGPHYGTQTNTLVGKGFYEVEGSMEYTNSMHVITVQDGCVTCHMFEGNHSFESSVATCIPCHYGVEDFDIGYVQTDVAELMDELKAILLAEGMIEETTIIEDEVEFIEIHPVSGKTVSADQAGAVFNFFGILDDGSLGVHNPKYIKAVLTNSKEVFD